MSAFRDMERRSLDAPPRRVAPRAIFRVLFGSLPSRFGWFFLVVGLFGLRYSLIQARQESWFEGPLETRVGHVTRSYELHSGKNHRPTGQYEIEFRYAAVPGGPESADGHSYTRHPEEIEPDGAEIVVEVPAAHPGVGRLQGLSLHSSNDAPALFALPLLGAIGALGFGLVRGRRQLRLLVDSRLVPATLDRHDAPGFFQKRLHRLYFVYDDHRGVPRSVLVKVAFPERFKRGPLVVAHDDSDPPRAVLLQALPGSPILGDDQIFRDHLDGLDLLLSLVLPVVGIVASVIATIGLLRIL